MKKIGIITFHDAHNYGATLQCMALTKFLKENNKDAEVTVINYKNKKITFDYRLIKIDTTNLKTILKSSLSSFLFFLKNRERINNYNQYINKNLPLSKECKTKKEIEEIVKDYDLLVTGSDQIWNPSLTGGIDEIYFLNFKTNAKKISYAASLGSNKMEDNIERYKKLLQEINEISVREVDGCKIIEKITNRDIQNVLDPTLLVSSEFWREKIEKQYSNSNYIFVYIPGNFKEFPRLVNYVSETTNKKIIHFRKSNMEYKNVLKNNYTAMPDEFLNCLYHSDLVIASSFHAVVFSIIFHKNFWVIAPKDNKSRINSLLEKLGLQDRIITKVEEIQNRDIEEKIDFKSVDKELEKLREESAEWLNYASKLE